MLFVFVMAAAAAIVFYRELPRIAFERQREKEQLLIERGEQYRRAIQLFVRKFNRYPAELSQLENTNNIRFLRRRYKDPLTGKAEWRLIHAGPGGVLLDSLVSKPAGPDKQAEKEENRLSEVTAAESAAQGPQAIVRRRASEMPGMYPVQGGPLSAAAGMTGGVDVPGSGDPSAPGATPPYYVAPPGPPVYPGQQAAQPGDPTQPGQGGVYYVIQQGYGAGAQALAQPGQLGQVSPNPGAQAGQPPYVVIPVQTVQPGSFVMPQPGQTVVVPIGLPGGQLPSAPIAPVVGSGGPQPGNRQLPPYPTQNIPGLPGPYGQPGAPSFGAITITPGAVPTQPGAPAYSTQPGVAGAPAAGSATFPQPGYQPLPAEPHQNPALQIIREILTKPRPGGLAEIQQQATAAGQQQIVGGGIAGVASTLEAESIMVYNERTKYNEWEFVYDIRKDPVKTAQLGMVPTPGGQQIDAGKSVTRSSETTGPPSLFTPPTGSRQR